MKASHSSNEPLASAAHLFRLPDLLPAGTRLLVHRESHLALSFSPEELETAPLFRLFPLTPSATELFFSLLQAYPDSCSHYALFLALAPDAEGLDAQTWEQQRTLALPLIRRALKSLLPTLRGCGLQAVSLRGQGYVLARRALNREERR